MALTVEDGTGKADAESYAAITDANTYHAALGQAAWAALSDAAKEQALRRATTFIDWRFRFYGEKRTAEQALAWPRVGATDYGWLVDDATVPAKLKRAVAEAALLSVTEELTPNGAPEGAVLSESVDVLSVSYAPGQSGAVRFKSVEALLAGLVQSSNVVRVLRS